MDNRNHPPALQTFTPITDATLPQHFHEAELALKLAPDSLRNLFGKNNLNALTENLDLISDDSIRSARKSIDNQCIAMPGDSDEVIQYFANKRSQLHLLLDKLTLHLTAQKQVIIAQYAEHLKSAQEKLTQQSECNLGNHALILDTLKQNIARALQHAAYLATLYWHDLIENPEAFNTLFTDVAHINPNGKLALFPGAMRDFAALNLADLQIKLNSFLTASRQHPNPQYLNPMVSRIINHELTMLCTNQGAGLISMDNGVFAFSDKAHEISQKAEAACVQANDVLNKLDNIQDVKIFEYENDPAKLEQLHLIRDTISRSLSGVQNIHAFVALNHNLASALNQDCNEVEDLLSQVEDIAERGPEDSRAATAALLENLEFTPALRKKIIDGMHEVFVNFHLDFQQKHHPHFIMQHYAALAAQLTAMQAQLNTILDEALTRLPPFTNEIQRVKEIEYQRNTLKQSLLKLYDIVESINLEYNKIGELFDAARQEFFKFLTNIQQNEWRADLLQRLDATLLDIDDLIKQYSNHPVFKHTSLDDVIIELMREAREKTLATRETVEPEFVPAALMPVRKLSFTERYPHAKKILFGVMFGIAAAVVATLAVAAVFFTVGFGILPAGSIAMILISAAIAGGAGGVAAGIGIHNKVQSSVKSNIQPVTAQMNLSSTADTFRKLNVHDKPAMDGYDSDDEEEVIADYSNHVVFAGDPPEYAPVRQRLT